MTKRPCEQKQSVTTHILFDEEFNMKKLFLFAVFASVLGLAATSGPAWSDVRFDFNQGQDQHRQDQQRQYERDRWQRDQWQREQHQRDLRHERRQGYGIWLGLHLHDYDRR
jgi:hypothetical protein